MYSDMIISKFFKQTVSKKTIDSRDEDSFTLWNCRDLGICFLKHVHLSLIYARVSRVRL